MLISILFIATFSIAIFTILKQKKLNAIKTDFVNNMTHEFKTPIATIKLAATAIKSPQVFENKETISGMAEVILQETSRMTQHVEQVLQIATLDRNGLKLNLTDEDANAFVRDVAGTMSLQVTQKGGSLHTVPDVPSIMCFTATGRVPTSSQNFRLFWKSKEKSSGT